MHACMVLLYGRSMLTCGAAGGGGVMRSCNLGGRGRGLWGGGGKWVDRVDRVDRIGERKGKERKGRYVAR